MCWVTITPTILTDAGWELYMPIDVCGFCYKVAVLSAITADEARYRSQLERWNNEQRRVQQQMADEGVLQLLPRPHKAPCVA